MPRRSCHSSRHLSYFLDVSTQLSLFLFSRFSPPPPPPRRSTADTTTLSSGVDALSPAPSLCRSDVISPTTRRNCTGANLRRRRTQSAAATPSPVQSDSAIPIHPSRGRTEEPRPTAPRSPSAPNHRRASITADDPPTRRPRRASITPFTRNPPPGESASTAAAHPISPIIPPRFIHVPKDLRESEIRPSTHVRVPGGIEDLSISLQEPPATGPIETDLFSDIDNPPDLHRRTGLQLYSAAEEQEDDDLYVPDSLVHGHAITPDSPLSPVEEERSARLSPPPPSYAADPSSEAAALPN
ncbi:hypothetical protein ACEPAF_4401 [Sanghuangporus sanghuang]